MHSIRKCSSSDSFSSISIDLFGLMKSLPPPFNVPLCSRSQAGEKWSRVGNGKHPAGKQHPRPLAAVSSATRRDDRIPIHDDRTMTNSGDHGKGEGNRSIARGRRSKGKGRTTADARNSQVLAAAEAGVTGKGVSTHHQSD